MNPPNRGSGDWNETLIGISDAISDIKMDTQYGRKELKFWPFQWPSSKTLD